MTSLYNTLMFSTFETMGGGALVELAAGNGHENVGAVSPAAASSPHLVARGSFKLRSEDSIPIRT